MPTTVGELLADVHARAWAMCSQVGGPTSTDTGVDRAWSLVAGWPRLAAAALRVLDSVAVEPAWLDDTASVRAVLAEWGREPRILTAVAPGARRESPDRAVAAIAVRLGAVADLLGGQPPARGEADRAAVAGLQADVLAVVHALATVTLAALHAAGDAAQPARQLLRGVLATSARFAGVPAQERTGRLQDVASIDPTGPTLDAALTRWVEATTAVLASRHRVTQHALQTAAGDAVIVTAAASIVCVAAGHHLINQAAVDDAGEALAAAHSAWRRLMVWPSTVRLGGVRDLQQLDAARELRQVITDRLRADRAWLPADVLAERVDLPAMLGTMRRGLHAVDQVALAHVQAVDRLVHGPGQLWVAAASLAGLSDRDPAIIEAACRQGWVPLPPREAPGLQLLADAKRALTTTVAASAALDATAATSPPDPDARVLVWEHGRIVARPAGQPASYETVRSPIPASPPAQRVAPAHREPRPGRGPDR